MPTSICSIKEMKIKFSTRRFRGGYGWTGAPHSQTLVAWLFFRKRRPVQSTIPWSSQRRSTEPLISRSIAGSTFTVCLTFTHASLFDSADYRTSPRVAAKDHFLPWNWDLSSVLGPKGTLSRADGESRCPCLNWKSASPFMMWRTQDIAQTKSYSDPTWNTRSYLLEADSLFAKTKNEPETGHKLWHR